MVNCNPSRTPVDIESKLGDDGDTVSNSTFYQSLAGALQYLTFTHPDISYAMQQVCLHMHDPREPHFLALKRILRYVCGTLGCGLHLFSSSTTSLAAYSDADWAGYPTTRRSTSEYRGVANVVAETCWLRNLLRELRTPLSFATLVYCDNVSVVYVSSNPLQRQCTKHIENDIYFVRDLVASGQVRVLHVPSRYQYADIFTKWLSSALFEEFRTSLSVRCPPAQTNRRGGVGWGGIKEDKLDCCLDCVLYWAQARGKRTVAFLDTDVAVEDPQDGDTILGTILERGRPPHLRPHNSRTVAGDEILLDSLHYKEIENGVLGEHANSSAKGGGEDEDWARNATQIVSKGVDQCSVSYADVDVDNVKRCCTSYTFMVEYRGEADSETSPKRSLRRKLFKTCCMNWGEVNPVHAHYNGSRTSKDNEDPSWSTSSKIRRTCGDDGQIREWKWMDVIEANQDGLSKGMLALHITVVGMLFWSASSCEWIFAKKMSKDL
ncbi:ribonuclease H-like domain-containing protein [Tanacetum coccineum]